MEPGDILIVTCSRYRARHAIVRVHAREARPLAVVQEWMPAGEWGEPRRGKMVTSGNGNVKANLGPLSDRAVVLLSRFVRGLDHQYARDLNKAENTRAAELFRLARAYEGRPLK